MSHTNQRTKTSANKWVWLLGFGSFIVGFGICLAVFIWASQNKSNDGTTENAEVIDNTTKMEQEPNANKPTPHEQEKPVAEQKQPPQLDYLQFLDIPDLSVQLTDPKLVIIDVRSQFRYEQSHIPGAVQVNVGKWINAFHKEKDVKEWHKRIGDLGITSDSRVVIYGTPFSVPSTTIWWVMQYWGVTDVKVLNGGWEAWENARQPIEAGANSPESRHFDGKVRTELMAAKGDVLKNISLKTYQLIDARSLHEFQGQAVNGTKRQGAIPGAIHCDANQLIDHKKRHLRPKEEVMGLLLHSGIDLNKPIIVYGSAHSASCFLTSILLSLDAKEVRTYFMGWFEWQHDNVLPIVTPQ